MTTTELAPTTAPGADPTTDPDAPLRPWSVPVPRVLTTGGPRSVVAQWLMTRAFALVLVATIDNAVYGDVAYYARGLSALFHGTPLRETLQEYPLPVLLIMLPQYLLAGGTQIGFELLFAASMLAVDGLLAVVLWRCAGRARSSALTFWICFVPCTGAIAYFRFDLLPGVLAGIALLLAVRRPATASALTAVGALLKLWPALTGPLLLLHRGSRLRVTVSFLVTSLLGIGIALAAAGWQRLISPLQWQADRGLQIESVAASPLMLARAVHPDGVWDVKVSRWKASEIFGWGVTETAAATSVLTVLAVLLLVWLWARAWRMPDVDAVGIGWLLLATTLLLTVSNKTLSPQYILWLGGPLAALVLITTGPDPVLRRVCRLTLLVGVMTHAIFPILYAALMRVGWYTLPVTCLLAARNVLLLYLTWLACRECVRRTARTVEPFHQRPAATLGALAAAP